MSSNIRVQRICSHCENEFTARTTVTQYCNDECSKAAYKLRKKNQKINLSNAETIAIKKKQIDELKTKQFLTVKEAAKVLNHSIRTMYRLIEQGDLKATNLLQRKIVIHQKEIKNILTNSKPK